jgi:hypothetical protein
LKAKIDGLLADTGTAASASFLRNLAADRCFGATRDAFAADPFARTGGVSRLLRHGVLDELRAAGKLDDCDVPLALCLWDATGLVFVDVWSVRRPPLPTPDSARWPLVASRRAAVEGEARFLQFQEQLAEIVADPLHGTVMAAQWFSRLPAAGVLPTGAGLLEVDSFFQGMTVRFPRPPLHGFFDGPVVLEGERLPPMLHASFRYGPIDTAARGTPGAADRAGTGVWLYRIRENRQAIDAGVAPPAQAVAFATAQLPWAASARFDVARWDYSNYGSVLLGPGSL